MEIVLTDRLESALEEIYKKLNLPPISDQTRQRLSSIPEEVAYDTLSIVLSFKKHVYYLDGLIKHLIDRRSSGAGQSPTQSPTPPVKYGSRTIREERCVDFEAPSPKQMKRESNGGSLHTPHQLALTELDFNKAFLLLTYIPGKSVDHVITADEIRQWKDLPMAVYEAAVWDRLGRRHCSLADRRKSLEWDSGKTRYYQCHVASDGSYTFKGPLLENTGTHLHKVLGDQNVLTVKFADVSKTPSNYGTDRYSTYRRIAKNGIMIGLRRYQFFVFKDGGKEEKKKDGYTKAGNCYFIRTDSTSPYNFTWDSIGEARMRFMHVHTLPSLAKYMARFSLILSKTKKLEVDWTGINFEIIEDIHCHDQNGKDVPDKNGEPYIHSDGTGYISEDLARMCPLNIFKGKSLRAENVKISNFGGLEACSQDPPLLIQFRMFYDGYAVKGTFLVNKKIPPRTVQVRPSMIKVKKDENLSNFTTFNALEVVNTSNQPRGVKLSRNLVALLSYGGVPNDFFLYKLLNTLQESRTIFYDPRAAFKAAVNYGEMDEYTVAEMIFVGIPLDEPYLKSHLAKILKKEKKDLKAGKLPVDESYYLMGTVDPTGKLKEDEVCVILKEGQLSGDVLVYRNPGLHIGDIHVLKATYVKELEEYVGNSKYAVFFPQKGPRSLGDEIAGGDFDGDLYFVSRNPELLQHFKPSEPWVSSTPPIKTSSVRKPNDFSPQELEEELFDMFLKASFQSSNVIGKAADSWLTIMDRFLVLGDDRAEEKDEMMKKMLKLIDIYYDALDAPKAGAKVDLPNYLRPDRFPHYMERDVTFKSTSILGLIYDLVVSYNAEEPTPSSEISKLACFKDEPVSEEQMVTCRQLYDDYKKDMSMAMKAEGSDKDEVIQKYKQVFYGAAGFEESEKSLEELYPQAIALYNVNYDYAIKKGVDCGFVWKVAGPVLCRFFLKKTQPTKAIMGSIPVIKEILGFTTCSVSN